MGPCNRELLTRVEADAELLYKLSDWADVSVMSGPFQALLSRCHCRYIALDIAERYVLDWLWQWWIEEP